jgi:hypothetical protein
MAPNVNPCPYQTFLQAKRARMVEKFAVQAIE